MRFPDQSLIGDLGDEFSAKTSASLSTLVTASIDENQTTYDLLPTIVNRPPVITQPIEVASTPQIKLYETADASGKYLYYFPDGTVKVNLGAKIKLAVSAEQPKFLNVENGILTMIEPTAGLNYVWTKDGVLITSNESTSLRSKVDVVDNQIIFDNIQPADAGTYVCEVSNDIGTTVTEPITIEVLNLDFDALFYRNLVTNPYGIDGIDGWQSNNSDFVSKRFSRIPTANLTRPDRSDLFGYNVDTMHPRPYQLDMGVIQGFNMTNTFLSENASYFSRTRYKFLKRGGSFLVRAYQDIDLSDIVWLTKGSVFGVEGVRAIFSCYIGNALTSFVPVQDLVDPKNRRSLQNYVLSKPRISKENFLFAGPSYGVQEHVYVSLEEYDNETRLASRILTETGEVKVQQDRINLTDPWTKRLWKYWGQRYYDEDIYGLGELSKGDGRDAVLFTADELYPEEERRFTHGQYAEFNKVIVDKLNPNTTKVRITINFQTSDWRIFEQWKEAFEASEEPSEFVSWEGPFERHRWTRPALDWGKTISRQIMDLPGNKDKGIKALPTSPDPRGFVSGVNLTLLPVLTQQKLSTEYYTNTTLIRNNTPESTFYTGLVKGGRPYDPYGVSTRKLLFNFSAKSTNEPTLNNLGYIHTEDTIKISLKIRQVDPQTKQEYVKKYPFDSKNILPFLQGSKISAESLPEFAKKGDSFDNTFNDYIRYRFVDSYSSYRDTGINNSANYATIAQEMKDGNFTVSNMSERLPEQGKEVEVLWNNRLRYQLIFGLKQSNITKTKLSPSKIDPNDARTEALQSYYLDVDFSGIESKVTLSRTPSTYPGFGEGVYELEHIIDPDDNLIITIPAAMKFASQPGLGFTRLKGEPIKIVNTPINCITALHRNLGDYRRPAMMNNSYFDELLDKIISPVETKLKELNQPSTNTIGITNDTTQLSNYLEALKTYGKDSSKRPSGAYSVIDTAYESTFEIDLTNEAFTGMLAVYDKPPHLEQLKKSGSMIELLAIYNPATTIDGVTVGAPSYGVDDYGFQYTIGYEAIPE